MWIRLDVNGEQWINENDVFRIVFSERHETYSLHTTYGDIIHTVSSVGGKRTIAQVVSGAHWLELVGAWYYINLDCASEIEFVDAADGGIDAHFYWQGRRIHTINTRILTDQVRDKLVELSVRC
ncbi:MAG: hypothetical protein H7Z14_03315 [Anaerolineae bacterium]|nr:hypothetical protein [Phycisphaerae bacterium]